MISKKKVFPESDFENFLKSSSFKSEKKYYRKLISIHKTKYVSFWRSVNNSSFFS